MKYFVAVLCLAQVVLSAPQNQTPTISDQLNSLQQQTATALTDVNKKFLEATGIQSNAALVNSLEQQAQAFGTQLQGVATQLKQFSDNPNNQLSSLFASLTQQLTESATKLLSDNDPAKADQLKESFGKVSEQANALNQQIQAQGAAASEGLKKTATQLYEQTLAAAKSTAAQLDKAHSGQR